MADVIGILSFALHAAHKVYNIIESIKDAPEVIQALRDDALQVHGFLERFLDEQASRSCLDHAAEPQVAALVRKAERLATAVTNFLDKATAQKSNGTHEVKRVKWPLYAGEARKLSEDFRCISIRSTLPWLELRVSQPLERPGEAGKHRHVQSTGYMGG